MARYVYYKTAIGTPYDKNDGKYAPVNILAELGRCTKLNASGNVEYGLAFLQLEPVLRSSIIILKDKEILNELDAWKIVKMAIGDIVKKNGAGKPIDQAELIRIADKQAAMYYRSGVSTYKVLTTLSIKDVPFKSMYIGTNKIEFFANRPRNFAYPQAVAASQQFGEHVTKTKYLHIRVTTSGRSLQESVDKAIDSVNVLRGLWTLLGTHGTWTHVIGSTKPRSIGVVHHGPIHTLHIHKGELATHAFWYDNSWTEDRKLFCPKSWVELEKWRKWAMRRMKKLDYQDELTKLVRRYVVALDSTDYNVAFLQMWSILEKITDTIGVNYDQTVERAIWPFHDHTLQKEILSCLRIRRNEYVHSAMSSSGGDQIIYLIKSLLDPHLLCLIRNDFGVKDLSEYGRCLSFSNNVATIRNQKARMEKLIKYLSS